MKKLLLPMLLLLCRFGYADTKISAMTSTTTLNATDVIPVVGNPSATPLNRIINKNNLITTLDVLTNSSATVTFASVGTSTASIQTQVNTKVNYSSFSATSPITYDNATGAIGATPISLSTQVVGTLPPGNLVSTVAYTNVANTFTSSQAFTAGLYYASPNLVNTSYTALSTDTVILASAPVAAGITISLPASSASKGQRLTISKIDRSTSPVTIVANGSDVISGTNTLRLNAFTQTDSIMADGAGNWIPWGQGLQITPNFVGPGSKGNSTSTINSSSEPVCGSFTTQVPVVVDSMTIYSVNTSSGLDVGIYDISGTRLASVGNVPVVAGRINYPLLSAVILYPGIYWECLVANNTTPTFLSLVVNSNNAPNAQVCAPSAGNIPLPATLPFPCSTTRAVDYSMWAHVVGGASGQ